jgi:hypothetical protein
MSDPNLIPNQDDVVVEEILVVEGDVIVDDVIIVAEVEPDAATAADPEANTYTEGSDADPEVIPGTTEEDIQAR